MDLVVGDVHATPDELPDVEALMKLVDATAEEHKVDRIVFLGDLHHTFAVTNIKVMGFYRDWFNHFNLNDIEVVALVGNHDMPGNGAQHPHALRAYEDLVKIADQPIIRDKTLFLPYYADADLFHKIVDSQTKKFNLIYCHQEFNGAAYHEGFFAPHGADPNRLPVLAIAGHIHKQQMLGEFADWTFPGGSRGARVWYPGSPRWRTITEANDNRYIYLVNRSSPTPVITEIPTGEVCKRIWSYSYDEDRNQPFQEIHLALLARYSEKDEYRFHVEGSAKYVKDTITTIQQSIKNCRISSVIRGQAVRVRESDGIDVAFQKYASSFGAKNGTSPAILFEKASKLLYEAQPS